MVTYAPDGAFDHLDTGETAEDSFGFTVSDGNGGVAHATATVTVSGASVTLTVSVSGLGSGSVTSDVGGIDCGSGGDACETSLNSGTEITLTASPDDGSAFARWTNGPCEGASGPCSFELIAGTHADARFELAEPPAGRIVAAVLPGARSGYVGGPDITVFATVISRQTTPAQSCRILPPDGAPASLASRRLDAENEPVGPLDPDFDLAEGEAMGFILILTPTDETDADGYVFFPHIRCENAELDPIEGVNSLLLSISDSPPPDILSIAVTPSGDGVIRINSVGGVGFMSAAAVNIGAGDGVSGPGAATVLVYPDTGAAALPLTVSVCETNEAGVCMAPRSPSVLSVIAGDAKFFAVFARADEDEGIAFDPANARVFLRFETEDGAIRSATSAAVTSPSPEPAAEALPEGRWSVLVRDGGGEWPSLTRGDLYVLADGTAILATPDGAGRLTLSAAGSEQDGSRALAGEFAERRGAARVRGSWRPRESVRLAWDAGTGAEAWGVRDARSDAGPSLADYAGVYGDIEILANGAVRGRIAGCAVMSRPEIASAAAPGLSAVTLLLSGCAGAGEHRAVLDAPANDRGEAFLIVAGETASWRIPLGR